MIKAIANNIPVRAAAIVCSDLVDEICLNQKLGSLASIAQGRCIVGASLMAAQLKEGHAVTLSFKGDGPLKHLYAEAHHDGVVRGYVGNPSAMLDNDQPLRIGDGIGKGILTVTINTHYRKEPQLGSVDIQTGEIGDDLAHYFYQSQQTSTIVALASHINSAGRVDAAGGVLVELLQDVKEDTIKQLELNVKETQNLTDMILSGGNAKDLISSYLNGLDYTQVEHPHRWHYSCKCSVERVHNMFTLIDVNEIKELISKNKDAEITCELCGKVYTVTLDDLKKIHLERIS